MNIPETQREDIVYAMTALLAETHDITFHQVGDLSEGWCHMDGDSATVYEQAKHNADRIEAKLKTLRSALRKAQSTANLRKGNT